MSGDVFTTLVPIRFAHCDPAGMTFFPRYFELVNGVVEDWMSEKLGQSFREMHLDRKAGVPTVKIECAFLSPGRVGDILEFSLSVLHIGRSSFTIRVAAHQAASGGKVLETTNVLVYSSLLDGAKSQEIPLALRQEMSRFLIADVSSPDDDTDETKP